MDIREKLINYFIENGKERKVDYGIWDATNGSKKLYEISSYTLNNIKIQSIINSNNYSIVFINESITDIHFKQEKDSVAYLNENLELNVNYLILNNYHKENRNFLTEQINKTYNELLPFLNNFKLLNKYEDKIKNKPVIRNKI